VTPKKTQQTNKNVILIHRT